MASGVWQLAFSICLALASTTAWADKATLSAKLRFGQRGAAMFGNWRSIDQTTRTHIGVGAGIVQGGYVWICDPDGQIPESENLQIRLFGHEQDSQTGNGTGRLMGPQLQTILISKGAYSCDGPPAATNAEFAMYGNTYDSHELTDKFWEDVGVEVLAQKATSIGLQVKVQGVCGSGGATAWPGSPSPIRVGINNKASIGACTVLLRLCAPPTSPFYRPDYSCTSG